jgi:hypothetical protein
VEALLVFALVIAFALVGARFGADSRDGDDWMIHRSV